MKKIFLLIALALLTISTATALDPIKVAIVNNGGAAVNVQVNLTNYTGGTATNVFASTSQSLTPNGSGIIMVDISDATYASGTTWSAITPASVNSYYVIDVNVGGNLYAQYRLDQQIISQAQTGVLDNDGNFTPAVNGDGSLGSDDLRWGELFIEGSTLHVGPGGGMAGNDELAFSYDDGTNTATMTVANKIAMTSVEDAVSITQQATIDGISIGQGGGDQITNTAVGKYALSNNTTSGNENTAIGFTALLANTTGDWNTATGYSALSANTTGNQNTASGYASLRKNSTGNGNIATGVFTLQNNTSGGSNTATGNAALQLNTLGSLNTATGSGALNDNISGNWNTATGASALNKNTGSNNTATGSLALNSNTTGENNTAVGYSSGRILETGSFNVFLGRDAGNNASQKVNAANSMALGANTFTTADNQVVIGDANINETQLRGVKLMDLTSPGTQNARITSTGKIEASSTVSVHFSASAPTSPITGSLWYEPGVGLQIWNGTVWLLI